MQLGNKFLDRLVSDNDLNAVQVNSASLDVKIGNKVKLITFGGYLPKSIIQKPDYDPYQQMLVDAREFEPVVKETGVDLNDFPEGLWIRPGVGVLLETMDKLYIPKYTTAQAVLKSSRGREFYQLMGAGFYDNGFEGQGNIQLCGTVIPIFLETGLRIVQLVFNQVTETDFDYSTQPDAKYQNQTGVQGSKDARF